jgi:hypothetical protein
MRETNSKFERGVAVNMSVGNRSTMLPSSDDPVKDPLKLVDRETSLRIQAE